MMVYCYTCQHLHNTATGWYCSKKGDIRAIPFLPGGMRGCPHGTPREDSPLPPEGIKW